MKLETQFSGSPAIFINTRNKMFMNLSFHGESLCHCRVGIQQETATAPIWGWCDKCHHSHNVHRALTFPMGNNEWSHCPSAYCIGNSLSVIWIHAAAHWSFLKMFLSSLFFLLFTWPGAMSCLKGIMYLVKRMGHSWSRVLSSMVSL